MRMLHGLLATLLLMSLSGCVAGRLSPTMPDESAVGIGPLAATTNTGDPWRPLIKPTRDRQILEARQALGAIITGEQVYFQQYVHFRNAEGVDELREVLHVELMSVASRWNFRVREASDTGFVATAMGAPGARTEGLAVRVTYVQWQEPRWAVAGRARGKFGVPRGD